MALKGVHDAVRGHKGSYAQVIKTFKALKKLKKLPHTTIIYNFKIQL